MEICGVFHRYCAVNERTIILGEPSPVQLKMCVHMLCLMVCLQMRSSARLQKQIIALPHAVGLLAS